MPLARHYHNLLAKEMERRELPRVQRDRIISEYVQLCGENSEYQNVLELTPEEQKGWFTAFVASRLNEVYPPNLPSSPSNNVVSPVANRSRATMISTPDPAATPPKPATAPVCTPPPPAKRVMQSSSPIVCQPNPIIRDWSDQWPGFESELPPVDELKALLRLTGKVAKNWDKSNQWAKRLFKRHFAPQHVVFDEQHGRWGFSPQYLKNLRQQARIAKSDLVAVRKCSAIFAKRGYLPLAKIVSNGRRFVQGDLNAVLDVLNTQKRLEEKPFFVEALDVIYRCCRQPLKVDALVGGRDLGGVYTELTMGSATKLTEELLKRDIIGKDVVVQDNGSGLGTFAFHLSYLYECYTVGVEIEPKRLEYGLKNITELSKLWSSNAMQERLQKPEFKPCNIAGYEAKDKQIQDDIEDAKRRLELLQKRVRMVMMDASDVPLTYVKCLYSMDEAFNDHECEEQMLLWAESASPFMVAYKLNKRPTLLKRLQHQCSQVVVVGKVTVHKLEGGGQSTAVILGKNPSPTPAPFTSCPGHDISEEGAERQTFFYPITEEGWESRSWIRVYNYNVVQPRCRNEEVRLRIQGDLDQECSADIHIRCSPTRRGRNCKCHIELTPLPETALELKASAIEGTGLFAKTDIENKQLIAFYKGNVSSQPPMDCTYVVSQGGYWVDARDCGLHAFCNHSCEPNCRFIEVMDTGTENEAFLRLAIKALRDIEAGEELTATYWPNPRDCSLPVCRCGASQCRYENNRLMIFFNYLSDGFLKLLEGRKSGQVLRRALDNDLPTQDARDQYRIELVKEASGSHVYAVSTDTRLKANMHPDFHLDCNVSNTANAMDGLGAFKVRFTKVYLDWMWTPLNWWKQHLSVAFFQKTLPAMATRGLLPAQAEVFVPFNPYTLSMLAEGPAPSTPLQESLAYCFKAEALTIRDLEGHELWHVTQNCDKNKFRDAFGKDVDESTSVYIQFNKREAMNLVNPEHGSPYQLKGLIAKLDEKHGGLERIRFIKLTHTPGIRRSVFEHLMS